jgi:microcystin-dependent protein
MSQPFLGQLMLVSFGYAPKGWALCNGQILPINQNQALFSLLGTTYGGNGTTTFQLPNLQSRTPISFGQGPGLQNYNLGQIGGLESETLIIPEMAAHTHTLQGTTTAGNVTKPGATTSAVPANSGAVSVYAAGSAPLDAPLAVNTIGNSGGGQPHENRPPFLVMNWIIALQGIFPSRS